MSDTIISKEKLLEKIDEQLLICGENGFYGGGDSRFDGLTAARKIIEQMEPCERPDINNLCDFVEGKTGTVGMEYQDYRDAVLEVCRQLRAKP